MALVVEEWPVGRLRDYEKNPRRNDHAIPAMVANLSEFGFRVPVLARSNGAVIDGHLRLKAARHMGMETVPVALADDLTAAQVKAFRLAVNKSSTWAEFDETLLREELAELRLEGFDLTLAGFSLNEIDAMSGLEADPADAWQGMPEFVQPDAQAYQSITVHFQSAEAVAEFAQAIGQDLHRKSRFTWYPPIGREQFHDRRYASGEADAPGGSAPSHPVP